MKRPSAKLIRQLAKRLILLRLPLSELTRPDTREDEMIGRVACGKALIVVKSGPDVCECCGKPVVRVLFTRKTKLPLKELFKA